MLRDIVFFAVIILLAVLVFILLMRRRHKNSMPVGDPEPTIVRMTRHLDDL